MVVTFFSFMVSLILSLNILLAIPIIFLERREPSSTWAWILVLFFFPVGGFILYLLLGRKLRKSTFSVGKVARKLGLKN